MRYAPPGMCLNDFAVIGDGPYYLLHLQGPWTPDFDAARLETSYGRAVSTDLVTWSPLAPAFGIGMPGRFDDSAIWTMHPFNHGDGMAMAYTGVHSAPHAEQSIGTAFSDRVDGTGWVRADQRPLRPDRRWYRDGPGEAWRDPWVVRAPEPGTEYAMVVAARARDTPLDRAGCVGLAVSSDLAGWDVLPPLLNPGSIDELECPVLEACPDGGWLLLGSVNPAHQIHAWRADSFAGPWIACGPIGPPGPYAPRIVSGVRGERLVLHTDQRRAALHDDGGLCRGMMSQPKLLDVDGARVRLRWWPELSAHLEPPVAADQTIRDAVIEAVIDGPTSIVIRDDAGPDTVEVTTQAAAITMRTRNGRLLQTARLDHSASRLRIFAFGEFIEVYADDILCLSATSYGSTSGPCWGSNPAAIQTVRPVKTGGDGRDDVSTPWAGPR